MERLVHGGALAAGPLVQRGVVLAADGATNQWRGGGSRSGSDWRSSLVAVSAASDDPQRQYDEANMEGMTMQEREEASHVENGKRKIGKSLPELETGAAVYGGLGLDRRTELGGIIRGICLPCSG